jgi:hypothetical protein
MPGTDYGFAVQLTFTQRPAAMAAGIVDRIEIAIEIKDGNELAVNINTLAAARLHVAGLANFDESHSQVPFLTITNF